MVKVLSDCNYFDKHSREMFGELSSNNQMNFVRHLVETLFSSKPCSVVY